MDLQEVLAKKQYCDGVIVAQMLGITGPNVTMILRRPRAKRHKAVIEAFTKVIESREKLLNKDN